MSHNQTLICKCGHKGTLVIEEFDVPLGKSHVHFSVAGFASSIPEYVATKLSGIEKLAALKKLLPTCPVCDSVVESLPPKIESNVVKWSPIHIGLLCAKFKFSIELKHDKRFYRISLNDDTVVYDSWTSCIHHVDQSIFFGNSNEWWQKNLSNTSLLKLEEFLKTFDL